MHSWRSCIALRWDGTNKWANMELCDVVDQFGNQTGHMVTRGTKLAAGEYYLVVHVWIRDENNNYLIQQRALHLESGPGAWATTVGYVLAGEESITGAIREVKEELGIQLLSTHLKRLERHTLENRLEDIWLAEVQRNSIGIPVPGNEAADCRWIARTDLEEMVNQGGFFRYSYHGRLI